MNNGKFIPQLVSVCEEILTIGNDISKRRKKSSNLNPVYKKLAKLLEERFNIKYEVIDDGLLATMPPLNSFSSSINDHNFKSIVGNYEEIANFLKDNDKVFSIDLGFYIDYTKKEIIYKGKHKFNAKLYVKADKLAIIGFSANELAATILHEIGHDFEYLRYAIYMSSKAEEVIQNIKQVLNSENALDKLIEISIKHSKKSVDVEELSTKDKIELVFNLPNTIFNYESEEYVSRYKLSGNVIESKEFETLADKFAVDLGVGHFLPSALNKITIYYNSSSYLYSNFVEDYVLNMVSTYTMDIVSYKKNIINCIMVKMIQVIVSALVYTFIFEPIYEIMFGSLNNNSKKALGKIVAIVTKLYAAIDYMLFLNQIISGIFVRDRDFMASAVSNGVTLFINYLDNYQESATAELFPYESLDNRVETIKRNLIQKLKTVKNIEKKKEILDQINNATKAIKETELLSKKMLTLIPRDTNIRIIGILDDPTKLNPMYLMTKMVKTHINNDLYIHSAKLELE